MLRISTIIAKCSRAWAIKESFSGSQARKKQLPRHRAALVCAVVESISQHNPDPTVVLRDPTGTHCACSEPFREDTPNQGGGGEGDLGLSQGPTPRRLRIE